MRSRRTRNYRTRRHRPRSRHILRNQRNQRNRRRSGSLCIPHNLYSLDSHGNRRIPAQSARGH
jgi:hypothetical protein